MTQQVRVVERALVGAMAIYPECFCNSYRWNTIIPAYRQNEVRKIFHMTPVTVESLILKCDYFWICGRDGLQTDRKILSMNRQDHQQIMAFYSISCKYSIRG